ncbi:hypothetical protein D5086_021895 [Populus alba]|uniref:Uncharacterized protein n=1 Tax=Populus alba TaxID=43335 RepID=A0ACC4BDG8_POPAL
MHRCKLMALDPTVKGAKLGYRRLTSTATTIAAGKFCQGQNLPDSSAEFKTSRTTPKATLHCRAEDTNGS